LVGTRNAIYSELRAKLGGNYIINCAHAPSFAYSGDSVIDYCVDGHQVFFWKKNFLKKTIQKSSF